MSTIDNYGSVLISLRKMYEDNLSESAASAGGLLKQFEKAETLLGLFIVVQPVALLEQLNKMLQARTSTVSGRI
jgi:hypothetical protein